MASESLRHDCAWAMATSVLEIFESLLREEEKRDAFAEIYVRVKAGIECFEIQQDRRDARLKPTRN